MHVAWRCSGGDSKVRAEKARDGEKKKRREKEKKEKEKEALH
jgi:hypothetical protein